MKIFRVISGDIMTGVSQWWPNVVCVDQLFSYTRVKNNIESLRRCINLEGPVTKRCWIFKSLEYF